MRKTKIGLFILVGLFSSYLIIEYFSFSSYNYQCENCYEEIVVHFIHGSYPNKNCSDQRKMVGGLLGGHIEIEIDSFVYGFEFRDKNSIHIFSRKAEASYNSKSTMKTIGDWSVETSLDKITSIHVPIDKTKKNELVKKLQLNNSSPPYDYSFFGMRCASATYEDLSNLGIFAKKSRLQYIVNAFYPRQLRKRMVQYAKHNYLKVNLKEGIDCRVWE